MAIGIDRAILLQAERVDWDPGATAAAITDAIRAQEAADGPFDLILFGNEAADTGDFQVAIRVAVALDRPCLSGLKGLTVADGRLQGRREAAGGGWETYDVPLPAVASVKEGLNLPRYPSVPGRLRARSKEVEVVAQPPDRRPRPASARQAGPARAGVESEPRSSAAVPTPRRPSSTCSSTSGSW